MLEALKRTLAFCVGFLAILNDVFHRRRSRSTTDASLLRELSGEKSATVADLSARVKVSQPAVLTALMDLEKKGLIRLSAEAGVEHVRIAAITEAGRQEVGRLH